MNELSERCIELDVVSVKGWTVGLKLHNSALGSKRGKPFGVSGALIFS